jgi:hypothetical protein
MTSQKLPLMVAIIATSLLAILFLTGASRESKSERWSISAVSGQTAGLYIMDQETGDIYFMDDDPRVASNRAKIKKKGNISDAR